MANITKARRPGDVTLKINLKDSGVAVDWSGLSDIQVLAYSVPQKAVAGRCEAHVDSDDHTTLVALYAASTPQYLGLAKVIVRATYMGRVKTYDAPAVEFVDSTSETEGIEVLTDPEIPIYIEVTEVSTSLLDEAIAAAFAGAELANLKADEASSAAAGAAEAATLAREKAQAADSAAGRANSSATNANNAAAAAVAATESIQALETAIEEAETTREERADADHERAETDHDAAADDHERAGDDHSTASDDHTQAGTDHGRAADDHATATDDHTTASSDHSRAGDDHTTAASDHSTAESDHTRAEEDHAIVQGYDTRLTTVEGEVSQLGQEIDEKFHAPDTEVGTFDNGYYNTNADTLPSGRNNLNGCKSAKIAVTPGQLYKIYGEALNNNYYRLYAFYDVNGNRIDRYSSSGTYRDTPLDVTVPANAVTMVVNLGNYAVATDKVLIPGEEYSFDKVYQDLGETNEEIEDVANSLIDHYRVELKGNSGSNLILPEPISLSQDGDSLEISVNLIAGTGVSGTRCYGLSSNGAASAAYISVGAALNRICVRAVDGTWIYDQVIVTRETIKVKIIYDDGKILVYLDDSLITTYNGQKEIKITSFGNGANGSYGYWAGYINYCKVNGQYYDFSKATANDAVVSPVEKYATLQQATTRGVLKYDSTNKAFTFFSQVAGNKYASFRVELNQNDSDLIYLKEWRLSTAKMCEYDGFDFAEVAEILYDAENEMAMRFSGAIDFTGGIHGDERIDVSPDSFVRFFAGGRLITDEEMASDFSVVCDSFSYEQYSTLHQTSATEGEYVTGHPIVATHYKRNTFENGASHLVNIVKMVGTQNVTVFHAGMACVGKGAGKYVILPIGVLSQELDGTKPDTYANHPTPGTAKFWNPETGVSAIVDGKFIEGYNNDTDVITSDTTHGFYVWDRTTDSKYYRRNLSAKQFQDGAVIINEQVIQYSA